MAEVLATRCREAKQADDIAQIESINTQLKALSRILIPLIYTTAGRFDHDPAWSLPPLPGLAATPKLAQLDSASDEYHFLRTALTRNRNAVNWALREALALLE
jgi:hypothetical protein